MGYLTFEEYQQLGGKCPEDAFPNLQFDIESKMDYITEGRLSEMIIGLGIVPKEVQMLEVKLVNIDYSSSSSNEQSSAGLTSYSNGIESFGYDTNKNEDDSLQENCKTLMMQYLYPKYPELFYRGRCLHGWKYNTSQSS